MSDRLRTAGAVAVFVTFATLWAGCAEAQSWRTVSSSRQLLDEDPVDVTVEYVAGELSVAPADAGLLYEMEMRYDEEAFRPVTEYDADAGQLRLGLDSRDHDGDVDVDGDGFAHIRLSRRVPLSLDLEFAAGRADLDLGGMQIRALEVSSGASETTIRFPDPNPVRAELVRIEAGAADLEVIGLGNARAARVEFDGGVGSTVLDFSGRWEHDMQASVDLGIGRVVLVIPRGLGLRVEEDSFLTRFDDGGLVRRGDAYYSSDWDDAAHRLTIDVDAAVGSIDIEWVD